MSMRRAAFIAGVVLLFAAWLLAGFWYGAPSAHASTAPYRVRVVERQMLAWTRTLFPREDLIGTDYSRYGATYQCYVDVHDPSDGYLSHGFYACSYRRSLRTHALRVRVPETAYVLVARKGPHRGGLACGHDLHPVSIAKSAAQPPADPGVQFSPAQTRSAIADWLVWSWDGTGYHPRTHAIKVRCARGGCTATYVSLPDPDNPGMPRIRALDTFSSCYTSRRVHRHRWWIDAHQDRAWVHVGRSITPGHADGGLVCRHHYAGSRSRRAAS